MPRNYLQTLVGRRVFPGLAVCVLLSLPVFCTGSSPANEDDTHLVHVVLVWLKEPGNADHRIRVIEATRDFARIPGILEIRVGTPVPNPRPSADDSFDVGLYMVFSSAQALARYLEDPEHKAAQQSVLRPLVRRVVVHDFYDQKE